ncbi:hypothetical protein GT358_10075 [Rubellimicrobium sp. CFH 75288]|nr:hypothetical protein [Rubellimicrobium sp. CFH 75288]
MADDYIAHRKAKRARLTPRAAQLIADRLRAMPDPVAAVEHSIAMGWTGVFDPPAPRAIPPPGPEPDLDAIFAAIRAKRQSGGHPP